MLLLVIRSYLLGSIPFSQIVARLCRRIDLRTTGSGNVGATSVLQQAGPGPGVCAALADAAKGALAAILGRVSAESGEFVGVIWAMIGHNWPVWLKFHGGGGLATFIGGMLVIAGWQAVVILLAIWGAAYLLVRDHDRSAILACSMAPPVLGFLYTSWTHFFFGLGAGFVVAVRRFFSIRKRRCSTGC